MQIVAKNKYNRVRNCQLTKAEQMDIVYDICSKRKAEDFRELNEDIYIFSTDRVYEDCVRLEQNKMHWEIYDK